MSTCAFCGERRTAGRNYLAHRITAARVRTVKVCAACVEDATEAGYFVTGLEPQVTHDLGARDPASGAARHQ